MSGSRIAARPLAQCLRQRAAVPAAATTRTNTTRLLSTSSTRAAEVTTTSTHSSPPPPPPPSKETSPLDLNPQTAIDRWAEEQLAKLGTPPVGSRRRRSALRDGANVPFEQLPYQCFQEARKVLAADREEKIAAIVAQAAKIRELESMDASQISGGEVMRQRKLAGLRKHVEKLKILADINDPLVKRRFEDGLGDMDKPIYRYLADRKWRSYEKKIIDQRISQLHIVPDILPKLDPTADVKLFFRSMKVTPGQIVDSLISEAAPRLRVQVFDKGERLVSVVVVDPDVPVVEEDGFKKRCHYLAANIPLSPNDGSIPLSRVRGEDQLAVPWLPAFSQKGLPYQRLAVFVLEQQPGEKLDVARLKELYEGRDGFSLKSYRDKFHLKPVGVNVFRTVWDEHTAAVMERAGQPGADIEFKRQHIKSLKEPRKAKGWEAKRMGPKYRHLWKYTHRIRGYSNSKGLLKRR